jgi:hypothetical protein
MALIAENHPALAGDSKKFWLDELNNSRILLDELNKAIYTLTRKEIRQYTINTGQDSQTVTRQDLPNLYIRREAILKQIKDLEDQLGITEPKQKIFQAVPAW